MYCFAFSDNLVRQEETDDSGAPGELPDPVANKPQWTRQPRHSKSDERRDRELCQEPDAANTTSRTAVSLTVLTHHWTCNSSISFFVSLTGLGAFQVAFTARDLFRKLHQPLGIRNLRWDLEPDLPVSSCGEGPKAVKATDRCRRLSHNPTRSERTLRLQTVLLLSALAPLSAPCATKQAVSGIKSPPRRVQYGLASWYGPEDQGRKTASGERFDEHRLTAAHRTLPLGTRARVTNLRNGRSVVVRIIDRGPRDPRRAIDLSKAAAERLRFTRRGLTTVRIRVLTKNRFFRSAGAENGGPPAPGKRR